MRHKSLRSITIGALVVLLCAVCGLVVGGLLAWRAVTVEDATQVEAVQRIAAVRASLRSTRALVEIDDEGRVVRMVSPSEASGQPVARLRALVWRVAERRLVTVDSPFWFFKLKGPAATFVLADTGLDLERLGLTPAMLEQFGPTVVIDHTNRDGSRLLVWTQ